MFYIRTNRQTDGGTDGLTDGDQNYSPRLYHYYFFLLYHIQISLFSFWTNLQKCFTGKRHLNNYSDTVNCPLGKDMTKSDKKVILRDKTNQKRYQNFDIKE